MYTDKNFKTKKALKDAVSAYNLRMTEGKTEPQWFELHGVSARPVTFYSPGPFPAPVNGNVAIEGPHYPEPHKWYASCVAKDGVIVSVK
jgi:hypothetical protein